MLREKTVAEGKRIVLTEAHILDAERVFNAINQAASANLQMFSSQDVTLEDERMWLNKMRGSATDRLYLIDFKGASQEDAPIGAVGLHDIDWKNKVARVGSFIFNPEMRGKGYHAEAMDLLQRIAFRELDLFRLEANVISTNAKGVARMHRRGYRYEGQKRSAYRNAGGVHDMILFSLLKTDR